MKIRKRDSQDERLIITGMIVNSIVLGRIASQWDKAQFRSKWANLVGSWCVQYWDQYGKPPRRHIQTLYESWASDNTKDEDTIDLVGSFLKSLSGEYVSANRELNPEYVVDLAAKHFNETKLRALRDELEGDLDGNDLDRALKRVADFGRVEIGVGSAIDVLQDMESLREAFESKSEPLIVYPGALEYFFGDALEREGFISFMAPEKRGKSWWLLDVAFRAVQQRRRVVFFEAGDNSRNQVLRRLGIRAARRPLKPSTVYIPKRIYKSADDLAAEVDVEERKWTDQLDWRDAWKGFNRVVKKARSKDSLFKLFVYPNSTLSCGMIGSTLSTLEKQGWVADVVVIDYADILAPAPGHSDSRDQINANWKQLRSLSQQYHCLIVTASQADANSYSSYVITKKNFTDDKRKLAHVTGMIGLNQTEEEKQLGLMRLNWVVRRESEFSETACCHVAGCLGIGNPAMKSIW